MPQHAIDDVPKFQAQQPVLRVLATRAPAPLVVMKLDKSHSGDGIRRCSGMSSASQY